jgi:hypothetical protein
VLALLAHILQDETRAELLSKPFPYQQLPDELPPAHPAPCLATLGAAQLHVADVLPQYCLLLAIQLCQSKSGVLAVGRGPLLQCLLCALRPRLLRRRRGHLGSRALPPRRLKAGEAGLRPRGSWPRGRAPRREHQPKPLFWAGDAGGGGVACGRQAALVGSMRSADGSPLTNSLPLPLLLLMLLLLLLLLLMLLLMLLRARMFGFVGDNAADWPLRRGCRKHGGREVLCEYAGVGLEGDDQPASLALTLLLPSTSCCCCCCSCRLQSLKQRGRAAARLAEDAGQAAAVVDGGRKGPIPGIEPACPSHAQCRGGLGLERRNYRNKGCICPSSPAQAYAMPPCPLLPFAARAKQAARNPLHTRTPERVFWALVIEALFWGPLNRTDGLDPLVHSSQGAGRGGRRRPPAAPALRLGVAWHVVCQTAAGNERGVLHAEGPGHGWRHPPSLLLLLPLQLPL